MRDCARNLEIPGQIEVGWWNERSTPRVKWQSRTGTGVSTRLRRQRGLGKTKDLIGRTIAQHVRWKTLYFGSGETATRTWKNKRPNRQNNSPARAFKNFVHFLAVLCKTTTWNNHNFRRLRTETAMANCFYFHLELNVSFIRHDAEVKAWCRMRQ